MEGTDNIDETGGSTENQTNNPKPTDSSKKRKAMKPRSVAWKHFEKYKDSDGTTRGKCNYCGESFAADTTHNGTSQLLTHLRKHCKLYPRNADPTQTLITFQPKPDGQNGDVAINNLKFDQELIRRALVRMIIIDEQPFSMVEKEGFKYFVNAAQPLFRIPSRRTVTRDCFELFCEERKQLKKFFNEANQRISITTDTWTSVQRINYMCLTAHFIDRDWKLHKKILNFCPISSHRGDDMADVITKCLLDWGLDNVFTVTVDNASSNDTTVKELSKQLSKWGTNMMDGAHLHVRCMAHIINLIVQDGLKEVGDSVKRVRQAVRYIRQSPARIKRFKDCCDIEKITCKKTLYVDVPTRWNSTYSMLETSQYFEKAFVRYSYLDIGLLNHLLTYVCEDGKVAGSLIGDDWENVRHMGKFLESFYSLTLRISGSLYITSNVHFQEISGVNYFLNQLIQNEGTELSKMARRMKNKFDKYWSDPEKMNKMIFIACIFDPRFKFDYVAFILVKMYGEVKGSKIRDEVKVYMTSLFNEYRRRNLVVSMSSSIASSSNTLDTSEIPKSAMWQLEYKKHKAKSESLNKTELEKYLGEETEAESENYDILNWWKVNSNRYPILADMARDVLAIPVSTVASESAFSTGGRILDSFRSSLTPRLVQALVCAQDWLRCESQPVRLEENLDYLEQLENEFSNDGRDASSIIDI